MLRTEQTFSLIYGNREHEAFFPFREIDFGDFEMKSYGELKDDPDYQTWIGDTTGTLPPPGGESACDFQMRVLKGFTELLQEQEKRLISSIADSPSRSNPPDGKLLTIAVCHGGPIAAILQNAFPDEKENFYQWLPDPGHGYLLTVEDGEVLKKKSF
jgi:alpha-ribazole phosphatase